jgi:hypothetical protein
MRRMMVAIKKTKKASSYEKKKRCGDDTIMRTELKMVNI